MKKIFILLVLYNFNILYTFPLDSSQVKIGNFQEAEKMIKNDMDHYWMTTFYFIGKNENNIKYLQSKLHSEDINEKHNAIMMLGSWYLLTELIDEFEKMYWQEDDKYSKMLIMNGLERIVYDSTKTWEIFNKIAKNEKDNELSAYAREVLQINNIKSEQIRQWKEEKILDKEEYKNIYKQIFDSYGKEGDYNKLRQLSDISNEEELFQLCERVSKRLSDEALIDLQKIVYAIVCNRSIAQYK